MKLQYAYWWSLKNYRVAISRFLSRGLYNVGMYITPFMGSYLDIKAKHIFHTNTLILFGPLLYIMSCSERSLVSVGSQRIKINYAYLQEYDDTA
jgi:hypothetical protein